MKPSHCSSNAFSLVELSIALAIIALILGSVVAGHTLMDRAEKNSIMGDIHRFAEAIESFKAEYDALPGDFYSTDLFTSSSGVLPGDGNGQIEAAAGVAGTTNETLQFWVHLVTAGKLKGPFDGSSVNVPSREGVTGGVPSSKITNSGYRVLPTTLALTETNNLVIELSGYGTGANTLGILNPADAWTIDKKMDDGDPTTGRVRATEGTDAIAGDCVSSGSYQVGETDLVCRLQFYLSLKGAVQTTYTQTTCQGTPVGMSRVSTDDVCDVGFRGSILQVCTNERTDQGDPSTGIWRTVNLCEPIQCGSSAVGETRTVSCPEGFVGFVREVCNSYGIWVVDDTQPSGEQCQLISNVACVSGVDKVRTLSCPPGYMGKVVQRCVSNEWQTVGDSGTTLTTSILGHMNSSVYASGCQAIECGVQSLGATRTSGTSCPSDYDGTTVTEICMRDGSWQKVRHECTPEYTSCSGSGTRTLDCPPGEAGSHIQQCNGTTWQTQTNTCQPVTCGGVPIGAVQQDHGSLCNSGTVGRVIKVCNDQGEWQKTESAPGVNSLCTQTYCLPSVALETVAPTCISGGTWDPSGDATCHAYKGGLIWNETIAGQRQIYQCPQGESSPCTWDLADAQNYYGCYVPGAAFLSSLMESGEIRTDRECGYDGNWVDGINRFACITGCPTEDCYTSSSTECQNSDSIWPATVWDVTAPGVDSVTVYIHKGDEHCPAPAPRCPHTSRGDAVDYYVKDTIDTIRRTCTKPSNMQEAYEGSWGDVLVDISSDPADSANACGSDPHITIGSGC